MQDRQRYSSGTRWEPMVGYSRAVRVGGRVYVTGTTATGVDGDVVGVGDPYLQTVQALKNIEKALLALESSIEHVVRTRIYVTDIEHHWQLIGRAHAEVFSEVLPATTMVEVSRLIDSRMLVEIEVEAED